ncbi:MAG: DUF853 domain-containing protein [Butyrivibrio sp.]|nr:DUF853 domain-containing protein [Butyrivibrio sp.]
MYKDGKIWVANTEAGENVFLLPKMANRHGLIAGATGTGKTVTLKVLAESFSDMGVPVFLADVKGDLAGMVKEGADSEDMQKRIQKFSLEEAGFDYQSYPVTFWDVFGEKGIPLRTTISEMGPLLLSRILGLNDLQRDILSIAFRIADENELLLIDTKDLKAVLNFMADNNKDLAADYGNISKVSVAAIMRSIVSLEIAGGEKFFFETALDIHDWFRTGEGGKGMINILDSTSLINNGTLYATFLLWMMAELFETLPEVGDLDKPKMVFFFDEAHLLFKDAPSLLMDKIEQVVKLIRSKGVGIYFVTQNPRDIPDGVLAQLGNKVQHALHAYTPSDMKAVKAAADSFRENPAFKTADVIQELGVGEAICSFLDETGIPTVCERVKILPPQSFIGGIDDGLRSSEIKGNLLYGKYYEAKDPDSAYEFLERKRIADAENEEKLKAEEAARKQKEKEEAAAKKEEDKAKAAEERRKKQAMKSVGNSVAGTVGREVGKGLGGKFGKFGKTLGGNLGASLGRGILSTFFSK